MSKIARYNRVSLLQIELAIETHIRDRDEQENLLQLCRDAMKTRPTPFAHAADRLHERGYHDLVEAILNFND